MKSLLRKFIQGEKYTRNLYAVTAGSYKGAFFVYINHTEEEFYFLSLPENQVVTVPAKEFLNGIKTKIIDHIEKLPKKVHEICVAQYNEAKAKDDINRLKQSPPPSSVDNREHKDTA